MRRYAVAMLGGRRGYDVPRVLERGGRLERLFTDITISHGWPRLLRWIPNAVCPMAGKRLKARIARGIPSRKISSFPGFGLEYARRVMAAQNEVEKMAAFSWGGREFCRRILETDGLADAGGIYVYNSAGLELLRAAGEKGIKRVLEQTIAPKELENRLLSEERAHFPGWEDVPARGTADYSDREKREWNEAERILCASEFVRNGIAECGGPAERCRVLPYGFSVPGEATSRSGRVGALRVLFAGTLGLRKGAPYLLETARRMKGQAVFRVVGPSSLASGRLADFRECTEVVGAVPIQAMSGHYDWADVLVLPSLCEGSAMVAFEALARGLPVLCTPNSGTVVRDGLDGFVVPIRDTDALVSRLEELAGDRDRLAAMSAQARARAAEFSEEAYGRRLLAELEALA